MNDGKITRFVVDKPAMQLIKKTSRNINKLF
jgi:hypothetical protein